MRAYRALLTLYPRAFREEYGEDMAQLVALQLRDEGRTRVWARTLLDLALSIPSLRLEAHMSRSGAAPVFYGSAALACLVILVLGGTSRGVALTALAGVIVLGSLAFVSLRRSRTLGGHGRQAKWWKYLAGGGTGLAGTIVFGNLGEELPSGAWYVFMVGLLTSVTLLVIGTALGLARLTRTRPVA